MPFVVDCSVSASWCFEDQTTPYTDGVLDRLGDESAVVPLIWGLEMANILAMAERRGILSAAKVRQAVGLLEGLPIDEDREGVPFGSILALAREHALSSYDAAYLEVAARLGLPLATLDGRLAAAAGHAGVALVQV